MEKIYFEVKISKMFPIVFEKTGICFGKKKNSKAIVVVAIIHHYSRIRP